MGQVVEALDPDLKRTVAVKSLLAGTSSSPEVRQKFLAEAQITGQLEHPNIVPIHEMGRRADGEI
jgi:serine/threonine protein kinase